MNNKLVFLLILLTIGGSIFLWDTNYRAENYTTCYPSAVLDSFFSGKSAAQIQKSFQLHFNQTEYFFPKEKVQYITVAKNIAVLGSLTSKKLSTQNQKKLIKFINQPDNYDWKKINVTLSETEYIIRFYNTYGKETGKMWVCPGCKGIHLSGFTPNIKFGHIKIENLDTLLQIIR
jgi:hypothetical protein